MARHGEWRSPLDAAAISAAGSRLMEPRVDGDAVYWLEMRPAEDGRYALVRRAPDGTIADVLPAPWSARTLVHEYGGGSYVVRDGVVLFTHFDDQRVYRIDGGEPVPVTPEPPAPRAHRYADFDVSRDGSTVWAVRERHEPGEVVNELVSFPADGSAPPQVVAGGREFYSSPRLSVDGLRLVWLAWDAPAMPWDGAELWEAAVAGDGSLGPAELVAGGNDEAVYQPEWGPDGLLYFVTDPTGWWNLYRRTAAGTVEALAPLEREFGRPAWAFASSTYGWLGDGRLVCTFKESGFDRLAVLGPGGLAVASGAPRHLGYRLAPARDRVWVVAGDADLPASVAVVDPDTGAFDVVRRGTTLEVDPGYLSEPEPIEFPTTGGEVAHAFFYPPTNRDFTAPPGELPPLLVLSHGGPTSAATPELDFGYAFWTSRGFALVDVNYRGSTGYGRAYRDALRGNWGVADVDDCVNAALHLAATGRVDPERMAIRGGSAGGYTTLGALAWRDVFAAGASYFGVGDLTTFVDHTHKFEGHYLDVLVGPLPEAADLYRERSPLTDADQIDCPVLVLQGLEDAIVPPAQAEAIVAALDANRVPHAYLAFPGEQHGFRRAASQVRAREAELWFYGRVFGFRPADDVEPVPLAHAEGLPAPH